MPVSEESRFEIREVSSPANPLLKVFRRALAHGTTREGWLAVEGPHLVSEALKAANQARVQRVLLSRTGVGRFRELIESLPRETEVVHLSDGLFSKIAQTETPQGIAALVELAPPGLEPLLGRHDALLVVACRLQDPGNLGTIMRSAQALGATGLIALEGTVSPFNPKAVRSSAGAVFQLPVFHGLGAEGLLARFRTVGVRTAAADQRSGTSLEHGDFRGPVAILVGSEAAGLPAEFEQEVDERLRIPIRPETDSLNAAVATAIFLYEAARQRGFRY